QRRKVLKTHIRDLTGPLEISWC
ncbi:hypothetical protein TcasGA2_TC035007, partial [Tribolium castaneum]